MQMKTSRKQVLSNRRNSRKSTGPKTAQGKRAVRWNTLKHGLLAKATILSIADFDEDPGEYKLLLEELQADLRPEGVLEQILLEKIASAYWRLRRVLRSEQGEVEQGIIDKQHDEMSHLAVSKQFAAECGLDLYHKTLSRSVEGVTLLLGVLKSVREDVIEDGFVTQPRQKLIDAYFGKDHLRVTQPCKHLSEIVQKNLELSELDPPKRLSGSPPLTECKERILSILDKEYSRLEESIDSVGVVEEWQKKATVARLCLPPEAASLKILRYETTIERQLYRAMDQLERLQRRRQGEVVPPPLKVDVTHDE